MAQERKTEPTTSMAYGFLQLCADKRFHRAIMQAFERFVQQHEPGFSDRDYWIEATAGGAPSLPPKGITAEFAVGKGARYLGWAAHGDECGGYPKHSDEHMAVLLQAAVLERGYAFPQCMHWAFLALDQDDDSNTDHILVWEYDPKIQNYVGVALWERSPEHPGGRQCPFQLPW